MKLLLAVLSFLSLNVFSQELDPNVLINGLQNYCGQKVLSYQTVSAGECPKVFKPLEPGEHRLMKRILGNALESRIDPRYTTGDYLLRHLPDGRYQAVLNLAFVPTSGASLEDAQKTFMNARQCMEKLSQYFFSPTGQRLEVVVLSPEEIAQLPQDQRPKARTVNVLKKLVRADDEKLSPDTDCRTIGHEVLHLLGLVDEYVEKDSKLFAEWSCRPNTQLLSYMRQLEKPFNDIVSQDIRCKCDSNCQEIMGPKGLTKKVLLNPNFYDLADRRLIEEKICIAKPSKEGVWYGLETYKNKDKGLVLISETETETVFENRQAISFEYVFQSEIRCKCEAGSAGEKCRELVNEVKKKMNSPSWVRESCPSGLERVEGMKIGASSGITVVGNELIIPKKGNGESLLRPMHFAKIIAGNCAGGAPAYETCSMFAYISQKDKRCKAMPPECNDGAYYLEGKSSTRTSTR